MIKKFILCTFLIAFVYTQAVPLTPYLPVSPFPIAPNLPVAPTLCVCPALAFDHTNNIQNSPLIFTGRVGNIVLSSNGLNFRVYFYVNTLFRGRTRSNRIIINTPSSAARCGFNFVIGSDYLVYTTYDANNNLQISSCSRTNDLASSCTDLVTLSSYLLPAVALPAANVPAATS